MDNVIDNGRGDCNGRLWTKALPPNADLWQSIHNQVGVIKVSQDLFYCYDMETGVAVDPMTVNVDLSSLPCWSGFGGSDPDPDGFSNCHRFTNDDPPGRYYLKGDKAWLQDGWVKYPEREHQHQFWLPPEWRQKWSVPYWVENVTTLSLTFIDHPPVIIKL